MAELCLYVERPPTPTVRFLTPVGYKKKGGLFFILFFFGSTDLLFHIGYGKQIKVERIRSRREMFLVSSFYRSPVTTIFSTFPPFCWPIYSHTFQVNLRFLLFRRENLKWRRRFQSETRKFGGNKSSGSDLLVHIDSSTGSPSARVSLSLKFSKRLLGRQYLKLIYNSQHTHTHKRGM